MTSGKYKSFEARAKRKIRLAQNLQHERKGHIAAVQGKARKAPVTLPRVKFTEGLLS